MSTTDDTEVASSKTLVAGIYARKSTEQTGMSEEAKSIQRQIAGARQYAARKGWSVDDASIFTDDGISGAEFANRPGFLRLMNSLKTRPQFQVLIMSEESRLGREAIETAYALKQLVTAGVRVFFYLEDRERKLDTPTEKIMLSLAAYADEMERDRARQRTYDSMARKAHSGHVTGGRVFGYDNVDVLGTDGKRSHVKRTISPTEARVVQTIFEMFRDGKGLTTIAASLNGEGAPSPRAQQGRPCGWSKSTVRAILRRPVYRGDVVWNRTRKRDRWGARSKSVRPVEEWLTRHDDSLRLVSDELWDAVHSRFESRAKYTGESRGRPPGVGEARYLLAGLARCSQCGGSMVVETRAEGTATPQRRVPSYLCSTHRRKGTVACSNTVMVPVARLDGEVIDALDEALLTADVVEEIVSRATALVTPAATDVDDLQGELRRIDGELARLTEAVAGGSGVASSLVEAIGSRERKRNGLMRALAVRALAARSERPRNQASVRRELRGIVRHWKRTLHGGNVQKSRSALRQLLDGPLTLTPNANRGYDFRGTGDLAAVLAGAVRNVASPAGFEPAFWP
jgi:site-specific DNA recombinase